MKKKEKFGYESKEMHAGFFEALEGRENPYASEEDLHEVMEQIQGFLTACYWIGVNPLRELRKILPQYEWKFHVLKDERRIRETVSDSDLIWRMNWEMDTDDIWADEIELVTATNLSRPDSEQPSHFFIDLKLKNHAQEYAIAFVKIHDGCPVYYTQSERGS
jgi:hypothetical protein